MLFWILVATLTAAVAAVLLLPLLRAPAGAVAPQSHDAEVYRDQLDELKRDETNGVISGADAALARAEVARRLLAATDAIKAAGPVAPASRSNRLAQLAIILVLPAIGLGLYLRTGHPDVPDAPLAARLANPGDDMNILIARAERHLVDNPQDGAGWDVLAPIYYRGGRLEEAAAAYENAARLLGATPARLGGYAESLIALSGGIVTNEAQAALRKSLTIEPDDPRASFYLALAMKQEGKTPEALAAFGEIVRTSPAGAPWLPLVNEHIASLGGKVAQGAGQALPGHPSGEDIAAASEMSAGDRTAMIEGMVGSLAEKLKQDPKNFEGWMRIIRSYAVLGRTDMATAAVKQSLAAFPAGGKEGQQLLALAGELGLEADGDVK
jgi:cytochrome c-type biogenesis protein CcmH